MRWFSAIGSTLRHRFKLSSALLYATFFGLLYAATRDAEVVLGVAFGFGLSEFIETLGETPTIDTRWASVLRGLIVTAIGLGWGGYQLTIATDPGSAVWIAALISLTGLWLLLDARQDFLEGHKHSPKNAIGKDTIILTRQASRVVQSLRQGPKTIEELAQDCQLAAPTVREAVATGISKGVIHRIEDLQEGHSTIERYALSEAQLKRDRLVQSSGLRLLRRLARPFRR